MIGAILMPRERIVPQSEVIRAIVLGDSPCCGVPDRRGEVRVVEAGAVLRVGLDAVVAEPAEPEVVPASAARASPANDRQREEATAAVGTQRQAEKEELLRHHFEWRHPPFEGGGYSCSGDSPWGLQL